MPPHGVTIRHWLRTDTGFLCDSRKCGVVGDYAERVRMSITQKLPLLLLLG